MKSTGTIKVRASYCDDGQEKEVTAEWEGGDVAGFSMELLEDADPRWLTQDGDIINCCQFKLKVIGSDDTLGIVYAQRIAA